VQLDELEDRKRWIQSQQGHVGRSVDRKILHAAFHGTEERCRSPIARAHKDTKINYDTEYGSDCDGIGEQFYFTLLIMMLFGL